MRLPDQHLTADELEELGKEEGLSGELGDQLRPAREHAASCPACQRRLEVYPTSGAKLEKLRAPQGAKKGPDCPSIEIWLKVAAGLLPNADQERYTIHAARCDDCGPILYQVIQDFSKPASQEEEAILSNLDQSRHQQTFTLTQALGKENSRSVKPAPRGTKWIRFPVWAASAAALAVCAVLALVVFRIGPFNEKQDAVASITQLLGKAYGEQRNTELRIPEAMYGPIRVSRAGAGSQFNSPPALLKAEGMIAPALETRPNDSELLRRKAEAELLRGNYGDAIATLNTILNQGNPSAAVLQDFSVAYFQSAEDNSSGENKKNDYVKAYQYASEALKIAPYNSEILFNRAIIDEKLQLLDQSITDWNQFLKSEHDPQWISEGSKYLQDVRGKKKLAQ